jgi:ornithine cyclodeaminase
MPTSEGTLYGFKYVNGHPKNTKEGRQTVTAFGVLSDVGNGYPILLPMPSWTKPLSFSFLSAVHQR